MWSHQPRKSIEADFIEPCVGKQDGRQIRKFFEVCGFDVNYPSSGIESKQCAEIAGLDSPARPVLLVFNLPKNLADLTSQLRELVCVWAQRTARQ
jgi:hypothetical protein